MLTPLEPTHEGKCCVYGPGEGSSGLSVRDKHTQRRSASAAAPCESGIIILGIFFLRLGVPLVLQRDFGGELRLEASGEA